MIKNIYLPPFKLFWKPFSCRFEQTRLTVPSGPVSVKWRVLIIFKNKVARLDAMSDKGRGRDDTVSKFIAALSIGRKVPPLLLSLQVIGKVMVFFENKCINPFKFLFWTVMFLHRAPLKPRGGINTLKRRVHPALIQIQFFLNRIDKLLKWNILITLLFEVVTSVYFGKINFF